MTVARRIVVAGGPEGTGSEVIASATADALRTHGGARTRVLTLDLVGRCAPRSTRLAAIAHRNGETFLPDGTGTLAEMAARAPEDPVLRELMSGGIATAESALGALEPDAVVATHALAAGIAAEVSARVGFLAASVVGDLWPRRLWVHPATALHFVAGEEARGALASRGVEWARIAVTGVPLAEPMTRAAARARLLEVAGMQDRVTAAVLAGASDAALADALARRGVQTLVVSPRPGAVRGGAASLVRNVGAEEGLALILAASDLAVCAPAGPALWEAPASSVPLIVVEPVPPGERSSVDLLELSGAALRARDAEDAAERAAYLAGHPERLAAMAAAAASIGRPRASRALAERLLAALAG